MLCLSNYGIPIYYTKKGLYEAVDRVRAKSGIDASEIDMDFHKFCSRFKGIDITYHKFPNRSIRGLAVVNEKIILLNSLRTNTEKNFDCAHEFFHIVLHQNAKHKTFKCLDSINQNNALEWHANEAGAEFLVPYRKIIPEYVSELNKCSTPYEYWGLINSLAAKYNVTPIVIKYRIDSLKYEITQYENGVEIENLRILSARQQQVNNIYIPSYHDRFRTDKKAP